MKTFLKWMFIILTCGIGLIFWPWLFPKLDDKDYCFQVDDLMVNMWVGKDKALKSLRVIGYDLHGYDEARFLEGRYGSIGCHHTVTARGLEYIRTCGAFVTKGAHWRKEGEMWKSFE